MEEEKVIQVSVQLPAQALQGFTDMVRQLRQLAAELRGGPRAGAEAMENAAFDDFFVEPVFRRRGAARLLAQAALDWCRERGYASLTVGCSPGDAAMYRSLGFGAELGTLLAADL